MVTGDRPGSRYPQNCTSSKAKRTKKRRRWSSRSSRRQLVAIQRAIEAIEGNAPPVAGRGTKQARKAVAKRKRAMTEEQRRALAERMRNYWASRRAAKAQEETPKE